MLAMKKKPVPVTGPGLARGLAFVPPLKATHICHGQIAHCQLPDCVGPLSVVYRDFPMLLLACPPNRARSHLRRSRSKQHVAERMERNPLIITSLVASLWQCLKVFVQSSRFKRTRTAVYVSFSSMVVLMMMMMLGSLAWENRLGSNWEFCGQAACSVCLIGTGKVASCLKRPLPVQHIVP